MRLGGERPKQFLSLCGRPILQRSVEAFAQHDGIAEIVVALPPDLVADAPDYLRHGTKPIAVIDGGERRQDSVANAFARVAGHTDVVVIHDAARPLVSSDLIQRTVKQMFELPCWVIDGRTPSKARQSIVDDFSSSPGSAALVLSPRSLPTNSITSGVCTRTVCSKASQLLPRSLN